ncbi:hypothetical protein Hdeb2414_s0019g00546491 [Helianthus debilis subsp. tardiflorus]
MELLTSLPFFLSPNHLPHERIFFLSLHLRINSTAPFLSSPLIHRCPSLLSVAAPPPQPHRRRHNSSAFTSTAEPPQSRRPPPQSDLNSAAVLLSRHLCSAPPQSTPPPSIKILPNSP